MSSHTAHNPYPWTGQLSNQKNFILTYVGHMSFCELQMKKKTISKTFSFNINNEYSSQRVGETTLQSEKSYQRKDILEIDFKWYRL